MWVGFVIIYSSHIILYNIYGRTTASMELNSARTLYPLKPNLTLIKNTIKQQRSHLFAKNATPNQTVHPPGHSFTTHNDRYNKDSLKQQLNNKIIMNSTPLNGGHRGLFRRMKYSQRTNKIQNMQLKIKQRKKTEGSLQVHNSSQHSILSPKFQSTERYIKRSYSITQPKQNEQSNFRAKLTGRILRTKSLQSNKTLSKIQRLQRYNQQQRIRFQLNYSNNNQQNRYKNEKLNILAHEHLNIIKKLPNYLIDKMKIRSDVRFLGSAFERLAENQVCITRHASQVYKTIMGLLIFYIGYEVYIKFTEDYDSEHQNYQLVLSNFYQIYYAMKLKTPLLVLESFLNLVDLAITNQNYDHAQRYAQKCLIASIFYNQKYYEQRCVQKISMCEYYKGNVCQATYLHDNNGQLTPNSIKQLRQYYNQQEQMDILFHHLYEVPKFSLEELLKEYEQKVDSYKSIVVFKSPRIGPEDSFNSKKQQLRIDLRTMERLRQFKKQAEIIRKQVKRHENLFTVRNTDENQEEFKLTKRNLVINEQNESSQVLKVHQSLNRVKKTSTKSLRMKLTSQFVEFIKKIENKFWDLGN